MALGDGGAVPVWKLDPRRAKQLGRRRARRRAAEGAGGSVERPVRRRAPQRLHGGV